MWLGPKYNVHHNVARRLDLEWEPVPRFGRNGRKLKAAGWKFKKRYGGPVRRTVWCNPTDGLWYEEERAIDLLS